MPLITVEGLDGAGKTTLVAALGERLGAAVLREPGGASGAEAIRALVKERAFDARAEALLFAAARAELVARELRPRLERGETLLLDRFVDSSLAYQGGGRRLGVDAVRAINAFACAGLTPARTLYLRIAPDVALGRVGGGRDHFEDAQFLARVADAYDALAAAEPRRWIVLDAAQPPGVVLDAAVAALTQSS